MKSRALAGDLGAIRLILERLVAPLKAAEQPAPINLPAGASLADTGRAMIAAAGGRHACAAQPVGRCAFAVRSMAREADLASTRGLDR
ncbi:MAG: hypothetical protein IPH51_21310 [Rubrivivax sp.]|nr:hypothetical protein [Rubrivivax sp.]